ncbi:MAG: MurR/RpiR family transcriptional regulator [Ruminococcaceae bacterium]|nr:MurR/RpiR family transcriptional regulator [Oscillospiraceae bacterium]
MSVDILSQIQKKMPDFSKSQVAISNFILEHYDKAAYMTASKLGECVKVSESTVVRFAMELGFEGYPELKLALKEVVRNKLTSAQRIAISNDLIHTDDVIGKVLSQDIDKIKWTMETVNREAFERAIDALIDAKTIYILGVRSSSYLAGFLGFYLNYAFPDVKVVLTSSGSEMHEQLFRMNENDTVFAISFPRYSKRIINAVQYAKSKNSKVIVFTDSETSPIASYADSLLIAKSDMASFVDSLVAPLSLINALLVAIGRRKKLELEETFNKLENVWEENDVYEKTK